MNDFDKQRIENAILILEQYDDEIIQIAKDIGFDSLDCNKVFYVLTGVKEQLRQ